MVYNGVDPARWPVGAGGDDLIWFGRITPEKGTHLAIAAARAAGRSLLVAGPISDRAYFRRSVEPHIGGTVTYLGHLYQAELAKQVARSAATLVTPTWDEPYGLVAAESMSCGTPVVAVRRGGLPELIDPTCGVVVEPDDIAALVAAIPQVSRLDRALIARHAFDRWSIESMVSRYERVYEALAGPYR
jgi:glycosyltransferase involved in cell wall biosynthesis